MTSIVELYFSENSYGFRLNRRAQQAIIKLLEYLNDGYTYIDDSIIAVGSRAAANRVMHTVTNWIERKLGLKVNIAKTKVTKPVNLKYLGFGFMKMNGMWETRQKRYWGLRKLGTSEWVAKKSVAFGDHYQAVAKITGLHFISWAGGFYIMLQICIYCKDAKKMGEIIKKL